MKKEIGLWIDHREAVIVVRTDKDEKITRIKSDVQKQIRFPGGSRKDGLQTKDLKSIWANTLMKSSLIFVMQS